MPNRRPDPSQARPQLTRDAWIDAACVALVHGGPEAVAVQPIAATLGATKGSFYWHFRNREELLRAALGRWQEGTERIIDDVDGSGLADHLTPSSRLRALLQIVTQASESPPGELRIISGVHDPVVRETVAQVTRRRTEYVARLLVEAGVPDVESERRAFLAYAWFLGYAQLAATLPEAIPGDRADRGSLVDDAMRFLLPEGPREG